MAARPSTCAIPAPALCSGSVPKMGAAETSRTIAAAQVALPAWRAKTAGERAKIMRKMFSQMIEHQNMLGELEQKIHRGPVITTRAPTIVNNAHKRHGLPEQAHLPPGTQRPAGFTTSPSAKIQAKAAERTRPLPRGRGRTALSE